MMDSGWRLMDDEWWLMVYGWRLMVDGWWLMDDGWWMMDDGWWMMADGNNSNNNSTWNKDDKLLNLIRIEKVITLKKIINISNWLQWLI